MSSQRRETSHVRYSRTWTQSLTTKNTIGAPCNVESGLIVSYNMPVFGWDLASARRGPVRIRSVVFIVREVRVVRT